MNSWIDFFYFFICGAALLLSVLALWFTIIMPGIDRWSKRFFLLFFTVLMLNCFSALLETVLLRYPVPIPPVIFLLVLESLFLALPLPMLTVYLLHCSGEDIRSSRLFRAVIVLWAVYLSWLWPPRSQAASAISRRTGSISAVLCTRFCCCR